MKNNKSPKFKIGEQIIVKSPEVFIKLNIKYHGGDRYNYKDMAENVGGKIYVIKSSNGYQIGLNAIKYKTYDLLNAPYYLFEYEIESVIKEKLRLL